MSLAQLCPSWHLALRKGWRIGWHKSWQTMVRLRRRTFRAGIWAFVVCLTGSFGCPLRAVRARKDRPVPSETTMLAATASVCAACAVSASASASAPAAQAGPPHNLQAAVLAWIAAWEAFGRPPQALPRLLSQCQLPEVASLYAAALVQASGAQWEAATKTLAQAAAVAPPTWCSSIRQRQALCALHQSDSRLALAYLQAAQHTDPQAVGIRLLTAQAYLADGHPADSVEALRPLLCCTAAPSPRELEQARLLTASAIEAGAGVVTRVETTALHNLFRLAQQTTVDDETVEMALSLAESLPRPRVQTAAALVALKAERISEGRTLLRQALAQAPLDPDPPRLLALYNVEHGGPAAALPCLEVAARRDPFNVETQRLVLELAQRQEDWPQASAAVEALERLEPKRAEHQKAARGYAAP